MWAVKLFRPAAWKWAVLSFGVLFFIAPVHGDVLPLPEKEQSEVDHAIEAGVQRLKETQLPSGTWVGDGGHTVGYAALPALTLLECGVPKNDPVLKKAEAFIRNALDKMDDTYELSLSILFLDRLGNRKDEQMIQGLALRLVAGQSPTGGWGYKCPITTNTETYALLKYLHQLYPKAEPSTNGKPGAASKPPAKPPEPPVILNRLSIMKEMSELRLEDPADKATDIIFATTDNSDTQFAILALWAAQRHDVPVEPTLRLIANRFKTSQNADGSWGYRYLNGGGAGEGPPMDCCGLLGLAVSHGIAHDGQETENAVNDPRIVNGFAALNKFVGKPAGHTHTLPAVNLYYLWSLGRVGVLYDLPTIAEKDWYRWGAEVLVANQSGTGDWLKGGPEGGEYPGATPTANTCFALLFLKHKNLVEDLTAALKLNPEDLTKAIAAKVAPAPPPPEPPAPAPKAPEPTKAPEPPKAPEPTTVDTAPLPAVTPPTMPAAPPVATTPPASGANMVLIWGLVVAAVLLLAAGGVVLGVHFLKQKPPAKVSKSGKKKLAAKQSSAPPPANKKPTGKMRPRA
jgi:hypothetical protein